MKAPLTDEQRSKRLRTITLVAGAVTAVFGLAFVLAGRAKTMDIVFIVVGLLVILAGLTVMGGQTR